VIARPVGIAGICPVGRLDVNDARSETAVASIEASPAMSPTTAGSTNLKAVRPSELPPATAPAVATSRPLILPSPVMSPK
jgi:hypothetical protein